MSGPMVRPTLADIKTQTRRTNGLERFNERGRFIEMRKDINGVWVAVFGDSIPDDPSTVAVKSPYGGPGDRLWVRETWAACAAPIRKGHLHYRADGAVGHRMTTNGGDTWWSRTGHTYGFADKSPLGVWVAPPAKWTPSIHMPRWASRITLEITGVRVERLQDISESDAIAEGVTVHVMPEEWQAARSRANGLNVSISFDREPSQALVEELGLHDVRYCPAQPVTTAVQALERLWGSINGPDSWAANPWVWVISFRRVAQ